MNTERKIPTIEDIAHHLSSTQKWIAYYCLLSEGIQRMLDSGTLSQGQYDDMLIELRDYISKEDLLHTNQC